MSPKTTANLSTAAQSPKSLAEAVGPLTQQAVDGAGDALTKKVLQEARNTTVGLATLLLDGSDPQDKAVLELLREVNIGMRDVQLLTGLGASLLTAAAERDQAEAEARDAAARFEAARTKLHDATTSFANLARGKLGSKSPALAKFGIKAIGGRKGVKRASKKPAEDKKDPAPGAKS